MDTLKKNYTELKQKVQGVRSRIADRLEVLKAQGKLKEAQAREKLNQEQRELESALHDLGETVKDGWDSLNEAAAEKVQGWLDRHGS